MKKILNLIYFILLASALVYTLNAQGRYSSNPVVKIGNERGEFAPDTAGIRKAFDMAEYIKEQRGIIPVVQFAPGAYQLDSTFIKLRDSVDVFFYGKVHFTTKHIKGALYDNNDMVKINSFGKPFVTNTTDPSKEIVLDNAGSSIDYLFAGGDSLDLQEALDRILELEDSAFQKIVFPDAQTIMFQNASGTNVGAFLLDPEWLENDGETISIKFPPPDFNTLDSTGGSLKVSDAIEYVNNAVKSNDTIYFRNKDNDTLFIVIDSGTGGGINNVSDDTSPSLGGDLDLGGFDIINTTPGFTLTPTEFSYLDGVSSSIQTQLNNKQAADADLDIYAGISPSANVQSLLGATTYSDFKTLLSLNNVENTAVSTWAGSSNLTTFGTNSVSLTEMQQISTATFLGRNTAGTGDIEQLSVATARSLLGLSFTYPDDHTISMAGDSFVMDNVTAKLNAQNEIEVHPDKVAKWDSVTTVAAEAIPVDTSAGLDNDDILMWVDNDTTFKPFSADSVISSKVTFEKLNANGDVGTGASQVAAGNHTHGEFNSFILSSQTITAGVTTGEIVELTASGWDEADASAEATADGLLGIYIGSNQVMLQGLYDYSLVASLTAGTLYWVSETEGALTSTKPSTAGTIVKLFGQALTTDIIIVNPDKTFVEN